MAKLRQPSQDITLPLSKDLSQILNDIGGIFREVRKMLLLELFVCLRR